MHIQQTESTKQLLKETANMRFMNGQIVRGRVAQLFPHDLARIQFGSATFIAQLEAPLEHGARYYFQVYDVKNHVHLRVIQQQLREKSEWKQLLERLGMKRTKSNEQLIQTLVQGNIPFTKRTLKQAISLLTLHENNQDTVEIIAHMMERKWPITNDVFQSVHAFTTSALTDEMKATSESVMNKHTDQAVNLHQKLASLLPTDRHTNQHIQLLVNHVLSNEHLHTLDALQRLLPQMKRSFIRSIEQHPLSERISRIQRPSQLLEALGIHDHAKKQVTIHTLQTLFDESDSLRQGLGQVIHLWEGMVNQQEHLPFNESFRNQLLEPLMKLLEEIGISSEQIRFIRSSFPGDFVELRQMMNDLQQLIIAFHPMATAPGDEQTIPNIQHVLTTWMEQVGLSYEQLLADGETTGLLDTLKGQLLLFLQHQGSGHERVQSLLHYLQGMQLHTVQETAHMLSVQLHIPAIFGELRSDMRITFESKKTKAATIDPNYCRILFDLELAALDRTLIDMQIQDEQISFIIYNDTPFIQKVAQTFEPSLIDRLATLHYSIASIRYEPLKRELERPADRARQRQEVEGIDLKI